MTTWWDYLTDDTLRKRLLAAGIPSGVAAALVADRTTAGAEARITETFERQARFAPEPRWLMVTISEERPHEVAWPIYHEAVESHWPGKIGPTAYLAARHLSWRLACHTDGLRFDLDHLAARLGVGDSRSKNAPLPRALARLVRFGLARWVEPGHLELRFLWPAPPVSRFDGEGVAAS